jgi:hypothetical protein
MQKKMERSQKIWPCYQRHWKNPIDLYSVEWRKGFKQKTIWFHASDTEIGLAQGYSIQWTMAPVFVTINIACVKSNTFVQMDSRCDVVFSYD